MTVHSCCLLPVPPLIAYRYKWLHTQAPYSLLAHDLSEDPKFIYANQTALHCFRYSENEFIGMLSRLSAAEGDRTARKALMLTVKEKGITSHYAGPRVNKLCQTFTINDGVIWQFYNDIKELIGHAALFWPDNVEIPEWFTLKK